jgi:hypothetical protein
MPVHVEGFTTLHSYTNAAGNKTTHTMKCVECPSELKITKIANKKVVRILSMTPHLDPCRRDVNVEFIQNEEVLIIYIFINLRFFKELGKIKTVYYSIRRNWPIIEFCLKCIFNILFFSTLLITRVGGLKFAPSPNQVILLTLNIHINHLQKLLDVLPRYRWIFLLHTHI